MKIKIVNKGNMYHEPNRKHPNDVGADVYSPEDVTIEPHTTVKLNLGFGVDIPNGYGGFVFPRGSTSGDGLISHLSPIDPKYSGPIHAILENNTNFPYDVHKGDRVGQLVIIPVAICDFILCNENDELENDQRGEGRFGSTGKHD